jgi:uncharacterized protein (TIGR02246 family)
MDSEIANLYHRLLDSWNERDAAGYAALFTENANVFGFDGSQMKGPKEIEETLGKIFADHDTGQYVYLIREIRPTADDVAILCAVTSMVPAGEIDIKPELNAVQSLVAKKDGEQWKIELFQNTPLQLHGHPELVRFVTDELRKVLKQQNTDD